MLPENGESSAIQSRFFNIWERHKPVLMSVHMQYILPQDFAKMVLERYRVTALTVYTLQMRPYDTENQSIALQISA